MIYRSCLLIRSKIVVLRVGFRIILVLCLVIRLVKEHSCRHGGSCFTLVLLRVLVLSWFGFFCPGIIKMRGRVRNLCCSWSDYSLFGRWNWSCSFWNICGSIFWLIICPCPGIVLYLHSHSRPCCLHFRLNHALSCLLGIARRIYWDGGRDDRLITGICCCFKGCFLTSPASLASWTMGDYLSAGQECACLPCLGNLGRSIGFHRTVSSHIRIFIRNRPHRICHDFGWISSQRIPCLHQTLFPYLFHQEEALSQWKHWGCPRHQWSSYSAWL